MTLFWRQCCLAVQILCCLFFSDFINTSFLCHFPITSCFCSNLYSLFFKKKIPLNPKVLKNEHSIFIYDLYQNFFKKLLFCLSIPPKSPLSFQWFSFSSSHHSNENVFLNVIIVFFSLLLSCVKISALTLLDSSTTLDTIDPVILLRCLHHVLGHPFYSFIGLSWFRSFLVWKENKLYQ